MEVTMPVLHFQKKGPHLSTMERFYIHKEATSDNQLNDKHIFPNITFDIIPKMTTSNYH
jgi:hypothetical protein